MTTYKLSGVVIDDEGVATVVDAFTTRANHVDAALELYTTNAFTGWLLLVRTELDGSKESQRFDLVRDHCTKPRG
ncbi:hypothetical protein [Pseudomonas viridiflava]|uniref:hypothetical protein n=1 Tax=Pseudomonas viridiflava TaxID=33069 RepID=UPI000F041C65|nr:hypothetical protein [Pseudomonas viridiflava]